MIDSLDDGVVVSDLEGRCLLSNPAARRLFATDFAGVPAAEWTSAFGCLLPDMVTPYPQQDMPLTRTLRGEVVSNLELFMVNLWAPQGVWLSVNGTPIRDPHGKVEGGVVVLPDVTRLKRKIHQIELLSNVVDATADTVIVTDRVGRIEYVDPAFETATGYTRAEVLGRNPSILKSGAHSREFHAGLWRTLAEGRVFRGMFINRKKSGELFFTEQTITPVRKPGGGITHVVSVGKDVLDSRGAVKSALSATGLPLGLFPDSRYETSSPLHVDPGDTLVLLTDGVTDCGVPEGELFGAERALEVIRSSRGAPSADVVEGLYRAERAFESGGPQRDDVTTVVVRRLPGG